MRITPEGSYRNASRLNPVPVPHVPVGKSEVRPLAGPRRARQFWATNLRDG